MNTRATSRSEVYISNLEGANIIKNKHGRGNLWYTVSIILNTSTLVSIITFKVHCDACKIEEILSTYQDMLDRYNELSILLAD